LPEATKSAAQPAQPQKAKAMLAARPSFSSKLDFVTIQDFEQTGVFDGAVKDVDAVIHVASVCPISSYLFSLFE
jgi:hypothetical protein